MTLAEHAVEFQHKVVIRLWLALGIRAHEMDDEVVEELLAEWQHELAQFTLEQIDAGRVEARKQSSTVPADRFRELCQRAIRAEQTQEGARPTSPLSDVARQELANMRRLFEDPPEGQ